MAQRIRYISPGDTIDHSAHRFNAYTDAVHRTERDRRPGHDTVHLPPGLVDVRAHSALNRLAALGIDGPGITPANLEGPWKDQARALLKSAALSNQHIGRFALALGACENADAVIDAVMSGVYPCRLWVPTNSSWCSRADIDLSDPSRLTVDPAGSAQILWQDTGENVEVDAYVRLSNRQNVSLPAVADADVAFGATGTFSVWNSLADTGFDLAAVHFDWLGGGDPILASTRVEIKWYPDELVWRVVGADCKPQNGPLAAQLADDGTVPTQAVTAAVPAAVGAFAATEEIKTSSLITLNSALAEIQIPDVIGDHFWTLTAEGTIDGPNNAVIKMLYYLNGTQTEQIDLFKLDNTLAYWSFGKSRMVQLAAQSSPKLALWIESDTTGTISWKHTIFRAELYTEN